MSKDRVVVSPDLMPDWLEKRRGIFYEIDGQLIRGVLTLDQMQLVVEHRNPFEVKVLSLLEILMEDTKKCLQKFFGQGIEIDPLPEKFTEENLARWGEFNLKPVFLPDEEVAENRKLKDYTKPEKFFYDKIREGKIAADGATLKRGWCLADLTIGVDYTDGTQVFQNDPLASLITKLREEERVGRYDNTPAGSRFAITNDEWRNTVCPAFAKELGFKPEQIRLERAIEFNAIGNLYDPNRGKFNMWEWFEDAFEDSRRLHGGDRRHGGLADVDYDTSDFRYGIIAGRPLVSFVK